MVSSLSLDLWKKKCMVGSKDHEVGKSILNSNNYKKGCRNNSVVVDIAGEMGNH